jgi:hypothetical protein
MTIDNEIKIDALQLISGAPIVVPKLELIIYQPRLYQVAELGEEKFYEYLSYFKISKKVILSKVKDKEFIELLDQKTDYEILKLISENEPSIEEGIITILKLVIKDIEVIKLNPFFIFIKTQAGQQYVINDEYFTIIKEILYKIFGLGKEKQEYNPANSIAADIAKKLQERKEKLARLQGKKEQSMFADFISILAVGLNCVDISKILNLTIYQILNIMQRFGMYNQYNVQIQAMLQGAEDVELIDWLQKI